MNHSVLNDHGGGSLQVLGICQVRKVLHHAMIMWTQVEQLGDHIRDRIFIRVSLAQRNVVEDMLVVWVEQNVVVWTTLNYLVALLVGSQLFKILIRQGFDLKLILKIDFIGIPLLLISCSQAFEIWIDCLIDEHLCIVHFLFILIRSDK